MIRVKSYLVQFIRGGSIGTHKHETSDDINYVISGKGKAVTNGVEEILEPGVCYICPIGSEHSIINTGEADLVLLTVVVKKIMFAEGILWI